MEMEEKINSSKKSSENCIPSKICGVCGDKALGNNFNAVTCESCKAFFRRNALLHKEFKCPFSEQCQITVITRRFCQKCRLEKCFAIGMVKEYIMSDEDKAFKRQKIAENKAKKKKNLKWDEDVSNSKMIKREENEDSTNSWTSNGKQMSPNSVDNYTNIDTVNNIPLTNNIYSSSKNNQTVSVIRNNSTGTNVENVFCEVNPYSIISSKTSIDSSEQKLNSDNTSVDPIKLNTISVNDLHLKISERDNVNNSNKERDSIRSILTTSPSNDDNSRLYAALMGNQSINQVICDNSTSANIDRSQHKADVARDVLQDVERIQVEPKSMKLILCEAIKLEFETYSSLPQINSSSRELNDAERARLNELIVANKALLAPMDDYMVNLVNDNCHIKAGQGSNDPMLLGIINLTAVAIRRLIKMSKKINAFKNMCEEDQVALLKGGCTEMMILRSTMTYDLARDTWKIPHSQESLSSIKADVLKLAKGNIYQEHERFVRTFDSKWRTDENIILILSAIVLFTPTRPRVVHSDVIKLEQNSYYYLLRRYLESVYPGCEAKSAFLKLIQKIMELQKLAEEVIGVYLDVNPSHVEPLLIEIFDLKQPQ